MKRFVELVIRFVKKIDSKLGLKIFLGTFTVLTLTFLICFLGLHIYLSRMYQKEFKEQFNTLAASLSEQFDSTSLDSLKELAKDFGQVNGANIIIFDPNTAETIFEYSYWDNIATEDLVQSSVIGFSNTEIGYGFYAETSLSSVNKVATGLRTTLPFLFFISLLISLIVSAVYAYSLARPLVKISEMSQKMKNLDLSTPHEIHRNDEIGVLAYNLNDMSERLVDTLGALQKANDKLEDDIERERALEKRRKDLFTAISHELKTPLTILKGELGGMIDKVGVYQNRDEYLAHAYETTESMEQLVKDILLTTRIDDDDVQLNFQDDNISALVSKICQSYEMLADEKGISLTYYCEESIVAPIDEIQLQHAIRNLVSNAIFHSPKGAMVDIQLVGVGDKRKLTIENSGVHITKEEIENIFEPFYRTEKSRNRYTGGSGLGLFIVKRVLELHNFDYAIKNSENGVLFTVIF